MTSPFKENPLSLSVPDEHFNAWVSKGRNDGDEVKLMRRTKSGRSVELRGRSLAQLSVDDLLKQARPWREFFGGSTPAREFSIPRSKPEVIYKLSENIYEFIGNYLLIALFCVVCVLYKRPLALLGIFIASKAWDWLRKHQQEEGGAREPPSDPGAQPGGAGGAGPGAGTGGGGAGAGGGRAQQQGLQPARSRRRELAHWAVTGFTWLVLVVSNVVPAMLIAACAATAAIALHGIIRNPLPPTRGGLLWRRRR